MGYIRLKNGQVALRPKTKLKWQEMQIISYDIELSWSGVVYGDDKFVALGAGYKSGVYSTDGITWTETHWAGKELGGRCLTYGGNKFVTAGGYSTDGITWTETTMPELGGETAFYERITYGGNKYVAVGQSYNGAYSTDGITWTKMNMPRHQDWDELAYGNGVFVALGNQLSPASGEYIARSTDGITWTEVTSPFSGLLHHMIFANGQFVILTNLEVGFSSDGETWNIYQHNLSFNPWIIAYGNNKFVVLGGQTDNSWAYSTDGITWTEATTIDAKSWNAIAYGNGRFVAVASFSNNGAYLNASDFNK